MSVIEKWIQEKITADKLSTLEAEANVNAALQKLIQVRYSHEPDCKYEFTSANIVFNSAESETYLLLRLHENEGDADDFTYSEWESANVNLRGTIKIYRWDGNKEALEANQTDEVKYEDEHVCFKCSYNQTFLNQCQFCQEFDIQIYGLHAEGSEAVKLIIDQTSTVVLSGMNQVNFNKLDGFVMIGNVNSQALDSMGLYNLLSISPPYFFIGESNITKAREINAVSFNGIPLAPVALLDANCIEKSSINNCLIKTNYEVPPINWGE